MRHTLYIHKAIAAIGVALMVTACQDDLGVRSNPFEDVKPGGIQVSIDNTRPYSMTRAKLIDSPGVSMDVEWEAEDAVGVYSTKGTNLQYTLAAEDITSNNIGTFRGEAGTPEGEFSAYFPYEPTASGTLESGLTLTMPDKQMQDLDGAKPMPDDLASAMVGKGTGGNVTLHSVHAILKIGYVALDSVDVMKSITFRDLSGRPVSGRYTVTLDDKGLPLATFPTAGGSDADGIITLECDSNYSTVTASDLRTFFIVVPARDYPQGFELTFHLKSGKTESKTIGKLAGKKLERAMVYPVGEVSIVREGSYTMEFNGEGFMMTEDQMALIQDIWPMNYTKFYERDLTDYSSKLTDMSKLVKDGPTQWAMVVDKRLDIRKDMTIVINRPSEALPYGLIAKVTAVDKQGDDLLYVEMKRYVHIEGAFKKLQMGATRYSADGTPLDGQSIDLGIDDQNLLAAPENPDNADDAIPYDSLTALPDSIINYDYNGESDDNGAQSAPRRNSPRRIYKHGSNTYSINRVSFLLKNDEDRNQKLMVGAQASLGTYLSIDIDDMHLNHLFMRFTPSLEVDVTAQMSWNPKMEGTLKDKQTKAVKSWQLSHLYFAPITVGPLVFVPECVGSVGGEFGVQLTLSAKWSYKAAVEIEMKYYRLYKNEDDDSWFNWGGVKYDEYIDGAIRNKSDNPTWSRLIPEISVDMSLYAQGSLYIDFGVGVYGLIGLDAYLKPSVTASIGISQNYNASGIAEWFNGYIQLAPGLEYGLRVADKRIPLGEVDFDPFWRRTIFPTVNEVKTDWPKKVDLGPFMMDHNNGDPNFTSVEKKMAEFPLTAKVDGKTFSDMQLRWCIQGPDGISGVPIGMFDRRKGEQTFSGDISLDATKYYRFSSGEWLYWPSWMGSILNGNSSYCIQPEGSIYGPSFGRPYYKITLQGRFSDKGNWWGLPTSGKLGKADVLPFQTAVYGATDEEGNSLDPHVRGENWGVLINDDEGKWGTQGNQQGVVELHFFSWDDL